MKKLLFLIVFAVSVTSIFANGFLDEFQKRESYIPDHVVLANGNDKYNYGISRNDDDQLSYSFDFKLEAPLWYLAFDANGITNRGWRDGWDMTDYSQTCTPDSSVIRGRYDSLETVFGLKLRPVEDRFYVHLYPDVGFALVGDYGWEWGQNVVHRILDIHEVNLPYDKGGEQSVFPMLGLRANLGYKLFGLERTNLISEVEASTKNILGFQTENQILARVSVSTETHDILGFHFGYMYAAALGDEPSYTQDLYMRYLNGWRVGFTVDAGIMFIKYTGIPKTNFGYGYLGFDVMSFFKPKSWNGSDAYFRFSKASFYDKFYNVVSVGVPLADHFDLVVKNSYLGGNPISAKDEAHDDLNKESRFKRNYSFFTIGARYYFPDFLDGYVTPYLELSGGLQIYKIAVLNNQLDDESVEDPIPPSFELDMDNYFGLISLEGGISVLPENLLVFEDTSVQIELFGGLNVILGGDTEVITIYRYIHKLWDDTSYLLKDKGAAARFIPYYGFGVKMGFDL